MHYCLSFVLWNIQCKLQFITNSHNHNNNDTDSAKDHSSCKEGMAKRVNGGREFFYKPEELKKKKLFFGSTKQRTMCSHEPNVFVYWTSQLQLYIALLKNIYKII